MSDTTCRQTQLAQGSCSQLSRCSCGHLHLALGPVTVRLEEPALLELFALLRQGVEALGHAPDEASPDAPGTPSAMPHGGWRQ